MDDFYMKEAIKEAKKAQGLLEVPVGAVIVCDGEIIARAHNLRETNKSSLDHAEMIAIKEACQKKGWRLENCTIYVTIEPCPMCSGAIIQSRIKRVVFGAYDPKNGCAGSIVDLFRYPFSHTVEVEAGILQEECGKIMAEFFAKLRGK